MAYTTANLNLVPGGTLKNDVKTWIYTTTDSYATVIGASYISDAIKKGMAKGDIVWMINTTTPTAQRLQVQSVSATAATLGDSGTIVGSSAAATLGFYGTAAVAQRTSAVQTAITTTVPVSLSGGAGFGFSTSAQMISLLASVVEIQATLTALGLWKGS